MSKYKIGDRVKIKTWEEMERKYGLNQHGSIKTLYNNSNDRILGFSSHMEKLIKSLNNNRIITIKQVYNNNESYRMEEFSYSWTDKMIECLASEYKEPDPIKTRFEILDL